MADQSGQPVIVQPPKSNTPQQVRVFSMPEKYRHGAVVNMVEPQKQVAPAQVVQAPVPPKPISPLPVAKKSESSHTKKGLLIAGVIVLFALGIGGYLMFRSVQKNTEAKLAAEKAAENAAQQAAEKAAADALAQQTQTSSQPSDTTGAIPSAVISSNPFPVASTPGVDTDSDGLTDTEESVVYGTDPSLPDTDGDGFLDGNEVFHGYNPYGVAPGTLVEAGLAQVLTANTVHLQFPTKWSTSIDASGVNSVETTTGEKITITAVPKETRLTLQDWYAQTVKDGTLNLSKTRKGFPLLVAKNQLTAYIDLGAQVIVLAYNTAAKSTVDYLTTFQMMVNSLEMNK